MFQLLHIDVWGPYKVPTFDEPIADTLDHAEVIHPSVPASLPYRASSSDEPITACSSQHMRQSQRSIKDLLIGHVI
ncbi:hypothetical protein K7X08_025251 [Anisodus acutangulus]|uniref:Uncharacterized protein n=1 Tax=Anisodus acutangulus TaxID=402998 RepID=A0A9Q1RGP8_9SOLA|nr:hypothetical protein K7X08_025251 [Anisodus acutangulus]